MSNDLIGKTVRCIDKNSDKFDELFIAETITKNGQLCCAAVLEPCIYIMNDGEYEIYEGEYDIEGGYVPIELLKGWI